LEINIVAAMDENGLIGNDNSLPWPHNKEDMKYFKELTEHGLVIMGRKTYESIGKPLKNRLNIVLTRDKDYTIAEQGVVVINDVYTLISMIVLYDLKVYVIGGAEIYNMFLPFATKLYLTEIKGKYEGNVYFPSYEMEKWEQISRIEGIKCTFYEYEKI